MEALFLVDRTTLHPKEVRNADGSVEDIKSRVVDAPTENAAVVDPRPGAFGVFTQIDDARKA